MEDQFIVTVRATSVTIKPGMEALNKLERLIDALTYEDEFAEETKTLGYLYDDMYDTLYLHRGVDINYIRSSLGNCKVINFPSHRYEEMNFEYEEIIAPRNEEQQDVINFICGQKEHSKTLEDSQIFLVKQPGFGKGEPYDSDIPTPNGYVKMGDLKVGDEVFAHDGTPTKIIEIFELGVQQIYQIEFDNGSVVECTREHLWPITGFINKDGIHEYNHMRNRTLATIMNGMNVLNIQYTIPSFSDFVKFNVNTDIYDIEIVGDEFTKGKLYCPIEYVYAPINKRFEFLKRIISSMGSILLKDNTIYAVLPMFHIKHENDNIENFNKLIKSLGYNIIENNKYSQPLTMLVSPKSWKIEALFDETFDKSIEEYDNDNDSIDNKKFSNMIIDKAHIKCIGEKQARCIKVDHKDNLYLTRDFIITHNTYCSGVGISKYKLKTLIIMHRDNLRKQWLHSLYNMSGYSSREVYELTSSQELYEIAIGQCKLDYDVYLMTHATFRAAASRIQNMELLGKITDNLGIGMKIIDEAHLEFRDTLLMDAVMNVKRNLYLTATSGRSSQDENAIFRHVFKNATFYKQSSALNDNRPKKWVDYVTIAVNTHCKPAIYQYRVAGGKGMSPATYGKWVIGYDKNNTHFKVCAELIKDLYNEDSHAKVLLFMPLIDLCDKCQAFLLNALDNDESFDYSLNIKTINSKNTKSENEYNKKADVIITTIASAGTGTDIPGITDIICCSPFKSAITAEQVFGRIRYIPKKCHYFDIVDESVLMDKIFYKCRSKKLKHLALNVSFVRWVE